MIRYLFLLTLLFFAQCQTSEARTISVNVIDDLKPVSFINEDGRPDGLYINLIEKIAQLNDWELVYYRNSWSSGIQKVRDGEIDLLFPVIRTAERSEFLDFHQQPVTVAWGQVVVRGDSGISALTDLAGKKIGIMKGGQNGINF